MFKRIVIGNGGMPNVYKTFDIPAPDDPGNDQFAATVAMIPAQQQPFFDENGKSLLPGNPDQGAEATGGGFGSWGGYARHSEKFKASAFLEALTYRPLSDEEKRAYDAPFPKREYMGGARSFPSLLNDLSGRTDAQKAKLKTRNTPLLTIIGGNDPGAIGEGDGQLWLMKEMPGAADQPHHRYPNASHFLQEDQGPDIATRIVAFIKANPLWHYQH